MYHFISIICEYNPFHTGHMYQINKTREIFGDETVILCVMSGHFVQRGDVAVFDKFARAEAAVRCGANLVLELPFPFSCASAEYFAGAGVYISDCAGADTLVFGSECGDIEKLKRASEVMSGEEFKKSLTEVKDTGIVKLRQRIYAEITGENSDISVDPLRRDISNDILAVEYINAIKKICDNRIIPYAIKREGAGYNDESSEMNFMSATGIRKMISENRFSEATEYIPDAAYDVFLREIEKKSSPASMKNIEREIMSFFRLAEPESLLNIADMTGGLQYRLIETTKNSVDIESFFKMAQTKKYTNARIRRAALFGILGVTEKMLKKYPMYTQVLAADEKGRAKLKNIKKSEKIELLTKPSDYDKLSDGAKKQCELSIKGDALYTLSLPEREFAGIYLKKSPFILNLS